MTTVAIYVRVSTEEQSQHGYSLREQEDACRRHAAEKLECAEPIVIRDEGISGGILERPGVQRLLAVAPSVQYVICKDPDRLARNLGHQLLLTEKIERAGAKLLFLDFERQATPEGHLFYSLRGAIAEYEKAKITARTMAGRWRKAQEGGLPSYKEPYGYVFRDGKLEIDAREAAVLRQMFRWFTEGMEGQDPPASPNRIADTLNREGVPTKRNKGGGWYNSNVRAMLKNPTYTGTLYVRRWDYEGVASNRYRPPADRVRPTERPRDEWIGVPVPAIIDEPTWHEAQRLLRLIPSIRPKPHATRQYLLTGLLFCGLCGARMQGWTKLNRRGERLWYYVCSTKFKGEACRQRYQPAPALEERVWSEVKRWADDPDAAIAEFAEEDRPADHSETEEALRSVEGEQSRLLRLYQRGIGPLDQIEAQLEALSKQERSLRSRLVQTRGAIQTNTEALRSFLASLAKDMSTEDHAERRRLLRAVVDRVTLAEDARVRVIPGSVRG